MTPTSFGDPARLDANHAQFQRLVGVATGHARAGRSDAAAAFAQVAAQFAWMNHTGLFASSDLEALTASLGRRRGEPARPGRRSADPGVVLHVLTQAYPTGGSTREVICWAEQDAGRRQRVCITRQGSAPPPDNLGGHDSHIEAVIRLDASPGGLTRRAAALRRIAADCDVVVLHTHPYDVVPVMAFADGQGPPVIFINHADHVFWLGTSIADVVMHMRRSGRDLATARRGVEPERSAIMPRPLRPPAREIDRGEAKRRLGIDPEQVVLVTAADATKYRPVSGVGFLDVVVPALTQHPDAILVAAGPSATDAWEAAAQATGGRVRALGRLNDITTLHQAADVYLDSFPFSSLTSLLEAGSYGTPTITYRGHPSACAVLGADTPGVDAHMLCPSDPAEFAETVGRLIDDAQLRRELGERIARSIRDTHTGPGWRSAADDLYRHAAAVAPPPPPPSAGAAAPPPPGHPARQTGVLDQFVDGIMVQTGFSLGVPGALRNNLALLPAPQRAAAAATLLRTTSRPTVRHLLPEWIVPHLAAARRHLATPPTPGSAA